MHNVSLRFSAHKLVWNPALPPVVPTAASGTDTRETFEAGLKTVIADLDATRPQSSPDEREAEAARRRQACDALEQMDVDAIAAWARSRPPEEPPPPKVPVPAAKLGLGTLLSWLSRLRGQ
jgi:hypothetical protein